MHVNNSTNDQVPNDKVGDTPVGGRGSEPQLPPPAVAASQESVADSVKALLTSDFEEKSKEELLRTSSQLAAVVPDGYQSWRLQADLFLAAIRQLETRQIEPDGSEKIMGIPLIESDLRIAAESALRNCAHFSRSMEEHILLIDEANRIRQTTWF